jgi:amidase
MTDLAFTDAVAQAELVRSGDAAPAELVEAAITRIEKLNPELNAVIHPRFEKARAEAAGTLPDGPFRGVPVVIKDLDGHSAGDPFHMGTRFLKNADYTPEHDTFLIAKLKAAGFVIVGKTNTPELGLLPTTEPLAYGPTHNPWDPDRTPGGSSGGSAASVASGLVPIGHAGDGGGSIRIPASACGLFGLKPARGRVSVGPDVAESWAGLVVRHVVTRSVRDSAAVLDAIAGEMPGDPYTAPPPARPFAAEVGVEPGRLRFGLRTQAPSFAGVETHADCVAAAEDAARLLESLGHEVVPMPFPEIDDPGVMEDFVLMMGAWVATDVDDLAALIGKTPTPDDIEPGTWMYAELGRTVTATQYLHGLEQLRQWSRRVARSWLDAGIDALLTPTLTIPPPELGQMASSTDGSTGDLGLAAAMAAFTAPFNVTGQPAMSVPLAWNPDDLPIGVQVVAPTYREDLLLRLASQLEAARPWAERVPPIHA